MRRPTLLACASFLGYGLLTGSAQAQEGLALDRFEPSERGSDWFSLESLDLRGNGRLALGVVGDYTYKPLVIYNADGSTRRSVVKHQLFLHAGASVVILDSLRIGLSLPIAAYQAGNAGSLGTTYYAAPQAQALGDLRIGADLRLLGHYHDVATLAIGAFLFLPTGSRSDYASDGTVRLMPRLSLAGDIGAFTYAGRVSFHVRPQEQTFDTAISSSEFGFGASAGLRFLDKQLTIGPELYGSTVVTRSDSVFARQTTPFEVILGGHYQVSDWRLGLGGGPGLTRGVGSPVYRLLASIEWAPPPEKPAEVHEDFVPPPPPSDRDKDGVLDVDDACPDVAGVKTDDKTTNGCPPPPPPPPDRDGDGVIDAEDACPDVPGEKTNDKATNGCPPPADRDGDGIIDAEDACPDNPGPKSADPKKNGCPVARVEHEQIKIIEQVKFKTNSSVILPESDPVLSAIAKIMTEHPEIAQLSIEGHTDNRGGKALNRTLSQNRAAAVVAWLVKHDIDKKRLSSKGFGPDRPVDTNDTDEGRQNNRRVELRIVGSADGAGKTVTEKSKP